MAKALAQPRCPECGCDEVLHDADWFCAGVCGGTCGGRNVTLLPTPRVTQAGYADDGRGGKSLDVEARTKLLPTPTSQDSCGSRNSTAWRSNGGEGVNIGDTLTDIAWKWDGHSDPRMPANEPMQDWREYGPAIRRWEHVLGRPAPAPTESGAKGQPRLSPAFVEWMQGLPEDHVTDPAIGISRNDQLKALGNGVVPQQCAAATRAFIRDTAKERAA